MEYIDCKVLSPFAQFAKGDNVRVRKTLINELIDQGLVEPVKTKTAKRTK